jgi:hypothetical protein
MISKRPPVLAHERFVADRDNFAGLDLAARFERIEQTNLWGAASSVSGLGSEDPATAAVREALPLLLQGSARARCSMRPAVTRAGSAA